MISKICPDFPPESRRGNDNKGKKGVCKQKVKTQMKEISQ